MVGGTATSESPSSRSINSISSTNSGLPSDASRIRSLVAARSSPPASRLSISVDVSSPSSGSSRSEVAFDFPPPQAGRSSSSSGRATQRTKIGAPRDQSTTCSIRSRNVGSAHWMSSQTTTSGRSAAWASSSLRVATAASFGDGSASTRSASAPSWSRTSTSGQYVIPSP